MKKVSSASHWIKFDILLLILVSSVLFVGLGRSSLLDFDEGIYAEVASEIVHNNHWLTLTYGDQPWFEKPPLYMWVTAVLFQLFGINEFWSRAASAGSGVLVVLFTYLIGSVVYSRRAGLLSVLPLLASYEFQHQARIGTTDVMLTLFILISIYAYIKLRKSSGYWYLLWGAFGLGFMVKFWSACMILIAIGISIVLEKKGKETLACKHFWYGALFALLIILPWHVYMILTHGNSFLDRYLFYDLVNRSLNSLEGNTGTKRFYLDRLLFNFTPWFLLLPSAFAVEFHRVVNKLNRTNLLLVFAISIFGVFSILVSTKIFQYITPIFPLLSIFIANLLIEAYDDRKSPAFYGLLFAFFLSSVLSEKGYILFILILLLLAVIYFFGNSIRDHLERLLHSKSQNEFTTENPPERYARPFAIFDKNNFHKLFVISMAAFLAFTGFVKVRPLFEPVVSPVEQIAHIAGSSRELNDQPIIGLSLPDTHYDDSIAGPAAMFYSDRPIDIVWTEAELERLTLQGPREIILGEIVIRDLVDKYDFDILAKQPPFVYGTIKRHEQLE